MNRQIPNHINQKLSKLNNIDIPLGQNSTLYGYVLYDNEGNGFRTEESFVREVLEQGGGSHFILTPRPHPQPSLREIKVSAMGAKQIYSQDAQEFGSWFYEKSAPTFRGKIDTRIFDSLVVYTIGQPFSLNGDGEPDTPLYVPEQREKEMINGEFNSEILTLKKINSYQAKGADGKYVHFTWTEVQTQPLNWKYMKIETDGFCILSKLTLRDTSGNINYKFVDRPNAVESLNHWKTVGNNTQLYPLFSQQWEYFKDMYTMFDKSHGRLYRDKRADMDGSLDTGAGIINNIAYEIGNDPFTILHWNSPSGWGANVGHKNFNAMRNIQAGSTNGGDNSSGYSNSLLPPKEANILQVELTPSYDVIDSSNGTLPRGRRQLSQWSESVNALCLMDNSTTYLSFAFTVQFTGMFSKIYLNDKIAKNSSKAQIPYVGTQRQIDNYASFLQGQYNNWNGNSHWSGFEAEFTNSNTPNVDLSNQYQADIGEISKGFGLASAKNLEALYEVLDISNGVGSNTAQQSWSHTGTTYRLIYPHPDDYRRIVYKNNIFFEKATNPNLKFSGLIEAPSVVRATNEIVINIRGGHTITLTHYDENMERIKDTDGNEVQPLTFKAPNRYTNPNLNQLNISFGSTRKNNKLALIKEAAGVTKKEIKKKVKYGKK